MSLIKKILVAEDDLHISKLIEFKLSRSGFEVKVVSNGQQVLDELKKMSYDLLVLDVNMPVLSGWDALKILRTDETYASYKDLPVVMLTARGQQTDEINSKKLGATKFLRKPFDPEVLVKEINELSSGFSNG